MRPIYFLFFIILLAACQNKSEKLDLIGHWHIQYPDSTFGTWDIIDSSEMIIDKNIYWSYYSKSLYEQLKDTLIIYIYGEQIRHLTYNYQNDTLFLSDKSYAIKSDTSQCDLQEEFFGDLDVNIELPYSKEIVLQNEDEVPNTLFAEMYIGNPKPYMTRFSKDYFLIQVHTRIQIGDAFIGYNNIQEYIKLQQSKLPYAERDNITIALSTHKQAPALMVDSIEKIINKNYPNLRIIYACLPGEKEYLQESVFASLKNGFAKPNDKSTSVLSFAVKDKGEVKWAIKEENSNVPL